jgi:hypothetical protein
MEFELFEPALQVGPMRQERSTPNRIYSRVREENRTAIMY